jgi:hypothetical protein
MGKDIVRIILDSHFDDETNAIIHHHMVRIREAAMAWAKRNKKRFDIWIQFHKFKPRRESHGSHKKKIAGGRGGATALQMRTHKKESRNGRLKTSGLLHR